MAIHWCFRICSYRTGTFIISAFCVIFNIAEIAVGAIRLSPNRTSDYKEIWGEKVTDSQLMLFIGFSATQLLSALILIVAAKRENSCMLIPWLVVECGVFLLAAVMTLPLLNKTYIIKGLIFLAYVLLTAYFLLVVYNYYEALRVRARARKGKISVDDI